MLPFERVPSQRPKKVQKHFIIMKIIHEETAYSLTVCTNTCMVFTYEFVVTPCLFLARRVTLGGSDLDFKSIRELCSDCFSDGAGLYAVTVPASLCWLTEPACLRPEYSPINEPSSLNSPSPSAYSTRLSLLMLSPAVLSPCRERELAPFSGFSSLSLPATTAKMDGQGQRRPHINKHTLCHIWQMFKGDHKRL